MKCVKVRVGNASSISGAFLFHPFSLKRYSLTHPLDYPFYWHNLAFFFFLFSSIFPFLLSWKYFSLNAHYPVLALSNSDFPLSVYSIPLIAPLLSLSYLLFFARLPPFLLPLSLLFFHAHLRKMEKRSNTTAATDPLMVKATKNAEEVDDISL